MKQASQNIPKSLIYEMVDQKPIYYKGYKEYLSNKKQLEEIMGSSYIQSLIISKLLVFLSIKLTKNHTVLTNELGLKFEKGYRVADIAIYENKTLEKVKKSNKYLSLPPKIVIEVDTKAETKDLEGTSVNYYHQKTDQLLDFGVEKVIWFFTDSKKIMLAEQNRPWQILNWAVEVDILEGISVKIEELIA